MILPLWKLEFEFNTLNPGVDFPKLRNHPRGRVFNRFVDTAPGVLGLPKNQNRKPFSADILRIRVIPLTRC